MAVAEYFARQAFIVGSDGAVQVSKPAMVPFGLDGAGAGAGLSASTGAVGVGAGLGAGGGAGDGLGGGNQPAAIPVGGGGSFGQAGLVASTTTGCLVRRIESPVRPVLASRLAAGRAVASSCSITPGSVP